MTDETQAFFDAIAKVSDDYDADVYLYSAAIMPKGAGLLVDSYPAGNSRKNGLLILATNGGLANSAFKIARFFHNSYETFYLFIPFMCKSAGTLIAVGAHKLIMGPFSELGPLDVQLYERDEIFSRKSGLLSHSAFEALKIEAFDLYEHFLLSIKARSGDNISFTLASSVASEVVGNVLKPIYGQISPNVLGSDYRDLRVAVEYGRRLAMTGENIDSEMIDHLTESYPSHDFIIDSHEAKELFKSVDDAGANLYRLLTFVGEYVYREHDTGIVMCLSAITQTATGERKGDDNGPEAADAPLGDSQAPDRPGADQPVEVDQDKQSGSGDPHSREGGSSTEEGA